jgi:hypothetical protein
MLSTPTEASGPAEWRDVEQQDQLPLCDGKLLAFRQKDYSACLEIPRRPELFPPAAAKYTTRVRVGESALCAIEPLVRRPENVLI